MAYTEGKTARWRTSIVPDDGAVPRAGRGRVSRMLAVLFGALLGAAVAAPVAAHVQLDSPNGGETLVAGDEVEIQWQVLIQHNLDNWDLWYSITGEDGPWLPIVSDLPAGDGTAGAMHSHLWVVPGEDSGQVRVRVRQDNLGTDYLDLSDTDLTIEPAPPSEVVFSDGFESGDLNAWTEVIP